MQKRLDDTTITIPIPDHHAELRMGTLQSVIRSSGIHRDEFLT